MNKLLSKITSTIIALLMLLGSSGAVFAYTTYIENRTDLYIVAGFVNLAVCSGDTFIIRPDATWSQDRGGCLLTEISAYVCPRDRGAPCKTAIKYESSGTGYERFIIEPNGHGDYIIKRP